MRRFGCSCRQSSLQAVFLDFQAHTQADWAVKISMNGVYMSFLGPRGPLRVPSSVSPLVPQEKSKSPLKPYKSSKDHARPLI